MPSVGAVLQDHQVPSDESVTSHQENDEDQIPEKVNPMIVEFNANLKELGWSQVFTTENSTSDGSTRSMIVPRIAKKQPETTKSFIIYTGMIMLLAGAGLYCASFVLRFLTRNPALRPFPELIKLIPLLLGLKGSIEMTYASRLGTLANTGRINSLPKFLNEVFFNLVLILGQAINVTLIAAGIILSTYVAFGEHLTTTRIASFLFSVLATATIASMSLALLITVIVRISQWGGINPDNICSPIAATAGDSVTLLILNYCGTFIHQSIPEKVSWICIGLILLSGVGCICIAWINKETREALTCGSITIVFSMLIGLGVGCVFQDSVERYESATLYVLILNGVGGNLVSILASRISTDLHKMMSPQKEISKKQWSQYLSPLRMWKDQKNAMIMASLLFMGIFIQMLEMIVIFFTSTKSINHPIFSFMYMFSSIAQFLILFYSCQVLTRLLFSKGINPDNNSIPLLTALGDLTGTIFLAISFTVYKTFTHNTVE